uniref:DUF6598 domain-containing protein n=1 Tax=Leersia perrieri TaxID=77586 RepID=A0A0D9W683_9ORYZ
MAVRDLMDPQRNYVLNHSRDDPFVMQQHQSDPFIYLPGPMRGVNMQARVLFEYDVRIKLESHHQEDRYLPLIDEVAIFSEKTCIDEPAAYRIRGGGGGAVDITWALLTRAVEATVEVWIQQLSAVAQHGDGDGGLDLSVSGFVSKIAGQEIKLFRGVVDKPCALNRFVVAVSLDSDLILHIKAHAAAGAGSSDHMGEFVFRTRSTAHGSASDRRNFDFATVEVKVTWSALYP